MGKRAMSRLVGLTLPLPTEPDPNTGGAGATPPPAGTQTVTMTQDELNRLAAERADRAKRDTIKEIASELGMSPSEAKTRLAAMAAAEQNAKTEEQKRLDAITAKEQEIATIRATTEALERTTRQRAALVSAGVSGMDNLDDAAALLARRLDPDADEAKVGEAVDALRKARPELFTAPASKPAGSPPAPQPTRGTNGAAPPEFGADGLAEARRRFPDKYATTAAGTT